MHIREIVAIIATTSVLNAGTVMTVWWQLDNKIDREITPLDAKVERLNTLLTDNLILLNRDIGELQGASHTHTP